MNQTKMNQQQRTLDWYRDRLGHFTGSKIGCLMRKEKSGEFSNTALSYIYQVAAERNMNPKIINSDSLFGEYVNQNNYCTKSMQWGIDQEQSALNLYSKKIGRNVDKVGFIKHPVIPFFGSSPDGYYCGDIERGCIEVKCPNQSTYTRYRNLIFDNQTLLDVNPDYYYQCMAHMMCTGAGWTDFVAYCPYQLKPIHIANITADIIVFEMIEERINAANALISNLK